MNKRKKKIGLKEKRSLNYGNQANFGNRKKMPVKRMKWEDEVL